MKSLSKIASFVFTAGFFSCLFAGMGDAQSVIFVNHAAGGNNNGSSWADAYTNLQSALAVAHPGNSIWVAGGIYRPDGGTADRYASFILPNGVTTYGGFAGNEALLEERVLGSTPTVLSGDLLGDDGPDFANMSDNSVHVVQGTALDESTVLDGFTIASGKANVSAGSGNYGGGILINYTSGAGSSPIIRNCIIEKCEASFAGSAYYSLNGNPKIARSIFRNNRGSSTVNLSYGNAAQVLLCRFEGNIWGSALYLGNSSAPIVSGCTFVNNEDMGGFGAGIRTVASNPTIQSSRFFGNRVSAYGGAISILGSYVTVNIANCVFSGNSASRGGAIDNSGSFLSVRDCTIANNTAYSTGGGISYSSNSVPFAPAVVRNTILWGNQDSTGSGASAQLWELGQFDVAYSLVQGWTGGGVGNLSADPLFIDADGPDNVIGTDDDKLQLSASSPCIDAGDNTAVPAVITLDVAGHRRFIDIVQVPDTGVGPAPVVDMGAYERTVNGN